MAHTTLADVANRANVSKSMVSLVLSGKGDKRCAPETAARIKSAAAELGYMPNKVAQSLRQQTTNMLGMISVEVATTPYAGELILAGQQAAQDAGFGMLFMEVGNNAGEIAQALKVMEEHRVEGVVIANYFHNAIQLPDELPKKLVVADAFDPRGRVDSFVPAEYASIWQCFEAINNLGHKKVAYLTDDRVFIARDTRLQAFRDAQVEFGWTGGESAVINCDASDLVACHQTAKEFFANKPDITAIACYNDGLALVAYQAAKEAGFSIPDDISVTGFDDLKLISEALKPGLTTVRLPHREMGQAAVERLIELCTSSMSQAPESTEIIGQLVERESLSAPKNRD
ncbi:MAG: hypothetical protein RLZZ258_412 [Actinomycetota bacterium]|jgi:LacI family transcriptional regulator